MKKWIVKRCIREYDEVWKIEDSEYETEEEAQEAADSLEKSGLCDWAEIQEN